MFLLLCLVWQQPVSVRYFIHLHANVLMLQLNSLDFL